MNALGTEPIDLAALACLCDESRVEKRPWTWSFAERHIDYGDVRTVFPVAPRYEAERAARLAVAAVNALPELIRLARIGQEAEGRLDAMAKTLNARESARDCLRRQLAEAQALAERIVAIDCPGDHLDNDHNDHNGHSDDVEMGGSNG